MAKQVKPDKTINKEVKHTLTVDELKDYGARLAKATSDRSQLEANKKAAAAEYKSKIEAKSAEAEELSTKISNGYEHRMVECEVFHNDPNTGMKRIVRKDTGEEVEKTSMTAEELQLDLPFDDKDTEDVE